MVRYQIGLGSSLAILNVPVLTLNSCFVYFYWLPVQLILSCKKSIFIGRFLRDIHVTAFYYFIGIVRTVSTAHRVYLWRLLMTRAGC